MAYKTKSVSQLIGTGDTILTDAFKSISTFNTLVNSLEEREYRQEYREREGEKYIIGRIGGWEYDIEQALKDGNAPLAEDLINRFKTSRVGSIKTKSPVIQERFNVAMAQFENYEGNLAALQKHEEFMLQNSRANFKFSQYQAMSKDELFPHIDGKLKAIREIEDDLNRRGMDARDWAYVHDDITQMKMDLNYIKSLAGKDGELNTDDIGEANIQNKLWRNYESGAEMITPQAAVARLQTQVDQATKNASNNANLKAKYQEELDTMSERGQGATKQMDPKTGNMVWVGIHANTAIQLEKNILKAGQTAQAEEQRARDFQNEIDEYNLYYDWDYLGIDTGDDNLDFGDDFGLGDNTGGGGIGTGDDDENSKVIKRIKKQFTYMEEFLPNDASYSILKDMDLSKIEFNKLIDHSNTLQNLISDNKEKAAEEERIKKEEAEKLRLEQGKYKKVKGTDIYKLQKRNVGDGKQVSGRHGYKTVGDKQWVYEGTKTKAKQEDVDAWKKHTTGKEATKKELNRRKTLGTFSYNDEEYEWYDIGWRKRKKVKRLLKQLQTYKDKIAAGDGVEYNKKQLAKYQPKLEDLLPVK